MNPLVAAELRRFGDDGVAFRARPNHVHSTWARTFSSTPELYIQPESLPEIEKVVNLARRCRRRLVTTGCGHSPSTITCTSSWLVNLDNFNKIVSVDKGSNEVVMQSGIRLYTLCAKLEEEGLSMPNLGSINEQSIAGLISTGTHGSSLRHGLLSEHITALKITLADGTTRSCSAEVNPELFKAALLSLGALGIITEITLQVEPAFKLKWYQTIDSDFKMLEAWDHELWTQSEFIRVWWLPHTRRAVVWRADRTTEETTTPPTTYYDWALGHVLYHNLLYLGHFIPRVIPWIEWFVYGAQYGFRDGATTTAVQSSHQALLLNCLYSQMVNEWAVPLHKGPEVLRRLSSWVNRLTPDDVGYVPHNIPFSAEGVYIHSPVEVRVSDTTLTSNVRPYLDPTLDDGPTLYLNAIVYRPYHTDSTIGNRYYEAFEYLMKEMGGRPHWAKNFQTTGAEIEASYGKRLEEFRRVRHEADPKGMFVGPWHRAKVMGQGAKLDLEEIEVSRRPAKGGGLETFGQV
ncbi:D-arabinono-1,4-lactone oxidase-domain-containing protein [Stachybotrys elegans]|uniref:D-arabinono-1,4-lactone oxidase n=1 Tax=Stachybotrys elegans TaxID=80388 RepID=A0A8K0SSW4_9HYPO|nr:D-arabinono-1,4-lactone oxidase-domain-containing protein [Stachybotrys elegans]